MAETRPARRLDGDLDRIARRAGRPTLVGALAAAFTSGGVVAIDLIYGGRPTTLALVAVGVLLFFFCPALVVEALRHRGAVREWALDQQRQRAEAQPPRPARRRAVGETTGRVTPLHEDARRDPRRDREGL